MDFYKILLEAYDMLFPYEQEIFSFLNTHLPEEGSILDLGCATGTYALALVDGRRSVTAVDMEDGFISRGRVKDLEGQIKWVGADMTLFEPDDHFSGVYCIGNTLPHLSSREQVLSFLGKLKSWLIPGGTVLLQVINFNRFDGLKEKALPVLTAPGLSFERRYIWSAPGVIHFEGILKNEKTYRSYVPLQALSKQELEQMLLSLGFTNLHCFGSYKGEEYEESSFLTIFKGIG